MRITEYVYSNLPYLDSDTARQCIKEIEKEKKENESLVEKKSEPFIIGSFLCCIPSFLFLNMDTAVISSSFFMLSVILLVARCAYSFSIPRQSHAIKYYQRLNDEIAFCIEAEQNIIRMKACHEKQLTEFNELVGYDEQEEFWKNKTDYELAKYYCSVQDTQILTGNPCVQKERARPWMIKRLTDAGYIQDGVFCLYKHITTYK